MKYFVKVLMVIGIGLTLLFADGEQQFARLGDFELENGAVIKNCQVGYRILGKMNPDKSNILLYPTWFGGTSEHVSGLIGPGKFVDNSELCVIIIDALGNGVSSSPSNSKKQKKGKFPEFTIHDMVQSQYLLLTEHLGIQHLYGIIGGSMGSFQTFEWLVCYPDFMDKALPYVCSPALSSYDLLQLQLQQEIIETARNARYSEQKIQRLANIMTELFGHTPAYVVEKHPGDEFEKYLAGFDREPPEKFTSWNKASQIRAMQKHNIFRHFEGSEENTARAIKAEILMIVSATDHIVNPTPARKFAQILDCEIVILENNCGHLAIGCEMERCSRIVKEFFQR